MSITPSKKQTSWKSWLIMGGIAFICLCVCVVVSVTTIWLDKDSIPALARLFPSRTPTFTITYTPTATYTPTNTFTPTPTATRTPIPTNTNTPTSTPTPLLEDNFSTNVHHWTALYDRNVVFVQENQLYLQSQDDGFVGVGYCSTGCGPFGPTFYYQADVVLQEESKIAYGLAFGLDVNAKPASYYTLEIDTVGNYYALMKLQNNEWDILIDWTQSDVINQYPRPNTLGVNFDSGLIQIYINDEFVDETVDSTPYNRGRIGFYVNNAGVYVLANHALVTRSRPIPGGQAAIFYQSFGLTSKIVPALAPWTSGK